MATKQKTQKKAKLCHAKYYDFQSIQDKLYADSLKGTTFHNLVNIITSCRRISGWHTGISRKTAGAIRPVLTTAQPRTWKGF